MQIQLPDLSMNVKVGGSGLPVLFIHGYPLNSDMWKPQIDDLSEIVQVVAPDLRGHGDSESTPVDKLSSEGYSMDLLAEDCASLLDNLNISKPIVLCGLSMGGYISFAFYRKYPHRVKGLILAATRAGADTPEGVEGRDKAIRLAMNEGINAIIEASLPKMMAPKTYTLEPTLVKHVENVMLKTSLDGIVGDLIGMKQRPDSTPTLSNIRVPTLLIHGKDDQIIPVSEVESMKKAIAKSRMDIIPDAGHLVNLEQPELFNRSVRKFLQGTWSLAT